MLLCAAPALMAASARKQAKAKPFTVVIDAGHGGKDTGAVDNNVKEKDINLGVAKELAAKIKKGMKNARVILTRDNDSFISLQGRADKANQAKADLFISIHTNSLDVSNKNRKSVAGASVYALGLHKDANNMAVARRENSVIELEKNSKQTYSGFDPSSDESYIIFEMAQKKNLSQSIRFANDVQKQLVETAGRKNRGVHQAGFWVLWATSMPAVLVELDFICNPNSAKFMASGHGQSKLADAIFKAVKKYEQNLRTTSAGKMAYEEMDAVSSPAGEETVVLASGSSGGRKVSDAPGRSSANSSYATARRRRRSSASREASDRRDVAASSITVNTHPARAAAPKAETRSAAPAPADDVKSDARPAKKAAPKANAKGKEKAKDKGKGKDKGKKKSKKPEAKTRMVNNREVSVSGDKASRRDVKEEKKKTDPKKDDKKKKKEKVKTDRKADKKAKEADKVKAEVKEAFSRTPVKSSDDKSRLNRGSLRGRNK